MAAAFRILEVIGALGAGLYLVLNLCVLACAAVGVSAWNTAFLVKQSSLNVVHFTATKAATLYLQATKKERL